MKNDQEWDGELRRLYVLVLSYAVYMSSAGKNPVQEVILPHTKLIYHLPADPDSKVSAFTRTFK